MTEPQKAEEIVTEVRKTRRTADLTSLDSLATEVRWIKRMLFALWGVVFLPKLTPAPPPDEIALYVVHLLT